MTPLRCMSASGPFSRSSRTVRPMRPSAKRPEDPAVTPALRSEGVAREVISRVQRMRKEAGLAVSDRIRLRVSGDAVVLESCEAHRVWIAEEVLATALSIAAVQRMDDTMVRQSVDLDGIHADLALTKDE